MLALANASCATVETLNPATDHAENACRGNPSKCQAIPRLYSGLAYNFCLHYGESRERVIGNRFNRLPLLVFDAALSTIADTLVLPFTTYQQCRRWSITVN